MGHGQSARRKCKGDTDDSTKINGERMNVEYSFHEIEKPGVYISLVPTQRTIHLLHPIWESAPIYKPTTLSPSQWHVTILYDRDSILSSHKFYNDFPLVGCDNIYTATAGKIVSWTGANGSIYRVLKLVSPQLQDLHKLLRKTFNFSHSFSDYSPHMTLSQDCDEMLPEDDSLMGKTLSFGGIRVENIKE